MSTSLAVTLILADSAQVADGKLYVIGGGWTRLRANTPVPLALGIIVHVPFDMTNRPLKLEVVLLDDDGNRVEVGGQTVMGEGEFEIGRPPGTKQGEPLNFPIVLNFNGLALDAGGYVWECRVQGETLARWPFRVV